MLNRQSESMKPQPQVMFSPPSSIHRTPYSNKKRNRTHHKIVLGDHAGQAGMHTERNTSSVHVDGAKDPRDTSRAAGDSKKRKEFKKAYKQAAQLSNFQGCSSFQGQNRSDSPEADFERDVTDPAAFEYEAPVIQRQIRRTNDNLEDMSASNTFERDCAILPGQGLEMYIEEGKTPSGVAPSKQQDTSSYARLHGSASSQEAQVLIAPREFRTEDKEEKIHSDHKEAQYGFQVNSERKPIGQPMQAQSMGKPLKRKPQGKKGHSLKSQNKENRFSDSYSKNWSNDSPFSKTFKRLLSEATDLKTEYEHILRSQLTPENPTYTKFVEKVIAKSKQMNSSLVHSVPLNQRREDLSALDSQFTPGRIQKYIERKKRRRTARSDSCYMVPSRYSLPSIASPLVFSKTVCPNCWKSLNVQSKIKSYQNRLRRYFSLSNGFTYRAEHSHGQMGGCHHILHQSSHSQQVLCVPQTYNNSSHSGVPTPTQLTNSKLEDLKQATQKVQIPTPQEGVPMSQQAIYEVHDMPHKEPKTDPKLLRRFQFAKQAKARELQTREQQARDKF